jgi:hypothetical protein
MADDLDVCKGKVGIHDDSGEVLKIEEARISRHLHSHISPEEQARRERVRIVLLSVYHGNQILITCKPYLKLGSSRGSCAPRTGPYQTGNEIKRSRRKKESQRVGA